MRPTAGSYEDQGLEMNAGVLIRAEDEDVFRRGWRDIGPGGEAGEVLAGEMEARSVERKRAGETYAEVEHWISSAARCWSVAAHWKARALAAERELAERGIDYRYAFKEESYGAPR